MERQMALVDTENLPRERPARRASGRQLDARTREIGRRGVAAARQALAEAMRRTAA